jgi:hypothetical protein
MAGGSTDRQSDSEIPAALLGVVLVLGLSVWNVFGSPPPALAFILLLVVLVLYVGGRWRSTGSFPAVPFLLGLGLAAGAGLIVYALIAFEPATAPSIPTTTAPAASGPPTSSTGSTTPTSPPPPTTTSPPVYTLDIDHDGKIDFVASGSQLVAVPKDRSDNAPVIVALIGGIFLVASTLGAAFVTALTTKSKKDGPAVVVQYPPAPPSDGTREVHPEERE